MLARLALLSGVLAMLLLAPQAGAQADSSTVVIDKSFTSCLSPKSVVSESVRSLARKELEIQWIPHPFLIPGQSADSLDVAGARLGEPFLDVTLREPSPDAYVDSQESDPRLFASVVLYCFPIYIPARTEPVGALVIVRNRDESGKAFSPGMGDVIPWGYYGGGEGRVSDAVRLRERFNAEVSFVQFFDTNIPSRIIIPGSTGLRSGADPDSLKPIADDAKEIKALLRGRRKY